MWGILFAIAGLWLLSQYEKSQIGTGKVRTSPKPGILQAILDSASPEAGQGIISGAPESGVAFNPVSVAAGATSVNPAVPSIPSQPTQPGGGQPPGGGSSGGYGGGGGQPQGGHGRIYIQV